MNRNDDDGPAGVLAGYRVLDLTGKEAYLAGKLLADLGADVIKVEPPGGDPVRSLPPALPLRDGGKVGVYWAAFNMSKRSITLNLDSDAGPGLFRTLAAAADIVLESFPPGYLAARGVAYEDLAQVNPGIIVTSVTPFGSTGPYAGYRATDIVTMAMGGFMHVTGDRDRPPLRISFPMSYSLAGAEAAAATMLASWHRGRTGQGQHVDVSIQECVLWTLMNVAQTWDAIGVELERGGAERVNPYSGVKVQHVWPCKDGYVVYSIMGGPSRVRSQTSLISLMETDGICCDAMKSIDWMLFDINSATQQQYDEVAKEIGAFFRQKTQHELYDAANRHGIMIAPVYDIDGMLHDRQLGDREYFVTVGGDGDGGPGSARYPRYFARMSGVAADVPTMCPDAGSDNASVYTGEAGLSAAAVKRFVKLGVI